MTIILPMRHWILKNSCVRLLLFSLLIACNTPEHNSGFEREMMLMKYISNEVNIAKNLDYSLVLVNTTDCGACNKEDILKIQTHPLFMNSEKKLFLFSEQKQEFVDLIDQNEIEVVLADARKLEKYGLRLFSTYIFKIEEGRIVDWAKLE